MKKILFALPLLLAACSTTTSTTTGPAGAINRVASFTVADLQAADADAVANNDQIAHACYPALIKFVQSVQGSSTNTTVAGAFSAFQKARDLGNQAQAGVPTYLTIGCAPLVVDTQTLMTKLAAIGVGSAATAGAIFPIPVLPAP